MFSFENMSGVTGFRVAGEPKRSIAARFELSESALKRHRAGHLPLALVRAAEAAEVADADALLDQVRALQRRARAYEAQAAGERDLRLALGALREQRITLELVAKMTGELEGPPEPSTTVLREIECPACRAKGHDIFPDLPAATG